MTETTGGYSKLYKSTVVSFVSCCLEWLWISTTWLLQYVLSQLVSPASCLGRHLIEDAASRVRPCLGTFTIPFMTPAQTERLCCYYQPWEETQRLYHIPVGPCIGAPVSFSLCRPGRDHQAPCTCHGVSTLVQLMPQSSVQHGWTVLFIWTLTQSL